MSQWPDCVRRRGSVETELLKYAAMIGVPILIGVLLLRPQRVRSVAVVREAPTGQVIELNSATEFDEQVLSGSGISVVDYYASWCGPCKMMEPMFEAAARGTRSAYFYRIDADKHGGVRSSAGVDAYPTVGVFKDGKLLEKTRGVTSTEALLQMVRRAE